MSDEYAEKFMDGGAAIASSRRRMPGWFFGLMGAVLLFAGGGAISAFIASGSAVALMPLLVTVPLLMAVTLLFSHLRATVTASQVIIQYGLIGPKIPLGQIESVAVEQYDMFKYGGWGLKIARDGTLAYSVPGGDGRCVRIEYRNEKGKLKKVVVTVEDAVSFAEAIERARRASGLRVATEAPEATARVDLDAEAEISDSTPGNATRR